MKKWIIILCWAWPDMIMTGDMRRRKEGRSVTVMPAAVKEQTLASPGEDRERDTLCLFIDLRDCTHPALKVDIFK